MKKGFTLIELLGTIILLSVVLLIVTPIIYDTIVSSGKNSYKITCNEIYKSIDMYNIYDDEDDNIVCNVFDFASERTEIEVIDDIRYIPVENLNLNGELPSKGTFKICNGIGTLIIDNGKYTCIKDKDGIEILGGTIEENNFSKPVINDLIITTYTNQLSINVSVDDLNKISKYYYKLNGNESVSNSNNKIFDQLLSNEEYEIEVIIEDKNGIKSDPIYKKVSTKLLQNPIMKQISQNILGNYKYATSRTIQIEFNNNNISNPLYFFKSSVNATVDGGVVESCGSFSTPSTCSTNSTTNLQAGVWYRTDSIKQNVTINENGVLYAIIGDGENISLKSSYTIDKTDSSSPTIEITSKNIRTDRVNIYASCVEQGSRIISYEYSTDGVTWINKGLNSMHTFDGLNNNTNYSFKVKCTNSAGLYSESNYTAKTLDFIIPQIRQKSQKPEKGSVTATERTIEIMYKNDNIENPEYYFKTSSEATVASGAVVKSCGIDTKPGNCYDVSMTTLNTNTWYKTNLQNIDIVYKTNGTLSAIIGDGKNMSEISTFVVNNIQ